MRIGRELSRGFKPSLRRQIPAAGGPHPLVLALHFGIYCPIGLPRLISALLPSLMQDPCFFFRFTSSAVLTTEIQLTNNGVNLKKYFKERHVLFCFLKTR